MKNGACWYDDAGKLIQAHGGMITKFGDKWYWYGENKGGETTSDQWVSYRMDVIGISCYSSDDLRSWHYEGLALAADPSDPQSPLHPSKVMERPKVIYCEKTGKYVMWWHSDTRDYYTASAGCAISDTPTGPFTYLHIETPNRRDCRDITVYKDVTDGKAYVVHSGDWNHTMYFSQLNDDYTGFNGVCIAQLPEQTREGIALVYHDGKHYCLSSGCTGWYPNATLYATTEHIATPMVLVDNPCEGREDYRISFGGQTTYIFEANGKCYAMFDHWNPEDLKHSGYSILPMDFSNGRLTIRWQDEFNGIE